MKTAAERIWAFHDGPFVGYFVGCEERGTNVAEYVRADIVATEIARLRAVLETMAKGRTATPDGWQAVTGEKDPTTQQGD